MTDKADTRQMDVNDKRTRLTQGDTFVRVVASVEGVSL